jgi:acyl-CoA thioesterase FadM
MNLWFRVLLLFLTAPFRARIEAPFGVSRLRFRVWPLDLDTNLHLNNGRYLTIADLGRADLLLQSGMWRAIFKEGLLPMLSGSAIRYRREIRPFQGFTLESRIVCWRATAFVMEHRFMICGQDGEPVTAAIALVRGGLYSKQKRQFVPAARLMEMAGYTGPSPDIEPDIETFLQVEDGPKRR